MSGKTMMVDNGDYQLNTLFTELANWNRYLEAEFPTIYPADELVP